MTRATEEIIWLLMACILIKADAEKPDWTHCNQWAPGCTCKWVGGRKTANCERAELENIPKNLGDEIQHLIMDYNNLTVLENGVFQRAGLMNLQKLSLKYCDIHEIEKNAFLGLAIVIEIDLTGNHIHRLDPSTFSSTDKLRFVLMNANKIQKLDDGLFSGLAFLQTVELDDNRISHIGMKAFSTSPCKTIKLNGNRLTHIKSMVFERLGSLYSLELRNNPWRCDCHLREFMVWYKDHLYTDPTTCAEPDYLQNTPWKAIQPNQFACKPDILWPSPDTVFEAAGDELTLACKVTGDPKPEAHWTFNSRTIGNSTVAGPNSMDRKYTDRESDDKVFWVNVTIAKINRQDHGTYTCVAKNPAGIIERNISISVQLGQVQIFGITRTNIGDVWVLLLCLFIGIVCALILIFMLCFLCCRRAETIVAKKPPNSSITSNGDITHHISREPEQQKTLLTAVNPVQKPPRKYDSSPQSDSGGAELTELNRNLLDDTSVLGGTSVAGDSVEERRSNNSIEQLSSCNSQDNLLLQERLRPFNRSHHPPDLLAFPNRRTQGSPAGSTVSTDADCSRFRAIHSPVRSPIYQMHPYTPSYETLPYSRTQSPFSPTSVTPVIQHRQGYVTIPRRPRVPSWSSAPTPTMEEALNKTEPVYDNLGPRTTADGGSVLSLNRKVADSPNIRTRPLPPAPLYSSHTLPHKSKLNHVYLSIRENEEPQFRPVNTPMAKENRGVIRPLPLQYSPSNETPIQDRKRASWAPRQVPETGTLRKTVPAESPTKLNPTSATSRPKVPPKPPPKPKKNGPLFEDEGEDGTEV